MRVITKFKYCSHFCFNILTIISFLLYSLQPIINVKAKALSPNQIEPVLTTPKLKFKVHSYRFKKVSNNTTSFSPLEVDENYYYALDVVETGSIGTQCAGLLGCNGSVQWFTTSNVIGYQDDWDAKLINSSHFNNGEGYKACMVVSLEQTIQLENDTIQAYVYQPQIITQDMGMQISVSDQELSCDSSEWINAVNYQEVGGYQGENWYGGTYSGNVKPPGYWYGVMVAMDFAINANFILMPCGFPELLLHY